MRAPLLVPALAFIGAIAVDAFVPGVRFGALALAAAALALRRARVPAAFVLAGLAVAAGRGHPAVVERESHTLRLAGTVVGDVRAGDDTISSTLALAAVEAPRLAHALPLGTRLQFALAERVRPGDRLVLRGRLEPFDEPRNPGEPSRRAIALAEGIAGRLGGAHLLARAPPDPLEVGAWPARVRERLAARLRALVPEPHATVIAGALWGERGTLPHALRDDFQATGTVHVLVTAGLHLGVIAACVLGLFRLARVPRIAASLGAIPCVVAYAWLSGAHLPSQRAAVMVSVALLARACGARLVSWNAVALAAIVVALLWPASVTSVSFALSFSCVGAIVLFARAIEHALARAAIPGKVREALALTISTQIGVWPLTAATFGLVAPYAVLANAVVVPATGVGMIGGMLTLASAGIPLLGPLAATIATWDVGAILAVVQGVAALPGARVSVAPPPALAIVAYDGVAVVAASLLTRRPAVAAALLAAASCVVLATTLRPPTGVLTITMLDVGQADGIVIRTPRGRTILIDSGGRLERTRSRDGESPAEEAGERVVLAYLRREGIRAIDLLVLTHPHGDHVGGCAPIVRALRVSVIADSAQPYGGRAYGDCLHAARDRTVAVQTARAGMTWRSGDGVALDILAPQEPFLADTGDDVNENSIVLRLTYAPPAPQAKPFRAIFTGDAGEASEARLLAAGADLRADLLKVGHHGSRYASTPAFVAAVHPALALISVGRRNTFGHPAPNTLATLHTFGARTLRTDLCGALVVVVQAAETTATTMQCRAAPRSGLHPRARADVLR